MSSEFLEEMFHCIRCDKELHLSDFFFEIYLTKAESKKYGVHASCLKAHDDLIGPPGKSN